MVEIIDPQTGLPKGKTVKVETDEDVLRDAAVIGPAKKRGIRESGSTGKLTPSEKRDAELRWHALRILVAGDDYGQFVDALAHIVDIVGKSYEGHSVGWRGGRPDDDGLLLRCISYDMQSHGF